MRKFVRRSTVYELALDNAAFEENGNHVTTTEYPLDEQGVRK